MKDPESDGAEESEAAEGAEESDETKARTPSAERSGGGPMSPTEDHGAGLASPTEDPEKVPRPLWRRPVTGLAVLACALSAAAAFLPGVPLWLGVTLVLGLGLFLLLTVVWEWSDALPSRARTALLVVTGATLGSLAALGVRSGGPWWLLHPIASAALVVTTLALGNWLARELERPGHLLPVCIIGSLADLWSVLGGPTQRIGEETAAHVEAATEALYRGAPLPPPPWASFLVYQWPQPGGGGMATLMGFGDLVFVALLVTGSRRFGLPVGRVLALVAVGIGIAMGLSFWWQRPVPALPLLCGLFVLGNLPALRLSKRELWITAVATTIVGSLVLLAALR